MNGRFLEYLGDSWDRAHPGHPPAGIILAGVTAMALAVAGRAVLVAGVAMVVVGVLG